MENLGKFLAKSLTGKVIQDENHLYKIIEVNGDMLIGIKININAIEEGEIPIFLDWVESISVIDMGDSVNVLSNEEASLPLTLFMNKLNKIIC